MTINRNLIKQTLYLINKILLERKYLFIQTPILDYRVNCFDNLLLRDHLCISEKETFFIRKNMILRPHSSNMQSVLFNKDESFIINNKKFYNIGPVFRKDKKSSRHNYFFHQFDGIILDKSKQHIKYQVEEILSIIFTYFGFRTDYLIRESYFPFTYPSYEIDIKHNNQWLEILGCGFTRSKILENYNLNKFKNKIFAFGIGIERLIMIKYNIDNIHTLKNI